MVMAEEAPITKRRRGRGVAVNRQHIRTARLDAGFSLREMGRRIGRSHACIDQIESGLSQPSPEVLADIAKHTGCSVEHLVEGASAPPPTLVGELLACRRKVSRQASTTADGSSQAALRLISAMLGHAAQFIAATSQ